MLNNFEDTDSYISALEYCNPHFVTSKIRLISLPDYVSSDLITEGYITKSMIHKLITKFKRKAKIEKYLSYIASNTKKLNIDLIHCHFANIGWSFISLKKRTGLPFVVSFYGFDYESLPHTYPVWEKRYKELFAIADMFICEGSFGAEILKSKGCPPEKIKIIHLGVELNKIPFFERSKNANELNMVQVCNFYQKKGHYYTLQAFKEALKTCPDISLTFVGAEYNGIRSEIQNDVIRNNLQRKVSFIDFIDISQLYKFLESYQVFIHPSCYADDRDCEGGAPVVLLDAQATGMPVISTTHCDIPEEVVHGKTGLLSEEKEIDALKNSIICFYKMDNKEYTNYAIAARKHIEINYDVISSASLLKKNYELLIS